MGKLLRNLTSYEKGKFQSAISHSLFKI